MAFHSVGMSQRYNALMDYETIKYETEEVTPNRLCNKKFFFEVSSLEAMQSKFPESARLKITHTLRKDVPECEGCSSIKVDEQENLERMTKQYCVSCGQTNQVQIRCKNETLYRRGGVFSYTRIKADDMQLMSFIPTDSAPLESEVPRSPDTPTTESDTW